MLIFVYGDDAFRAREKVLQLTDAFAKKFDPSGMNLDRFPGPSGKLSPGEALQSVRSAPFLSEKRMVVIRDLLPSMKKDEEAVWLDGLSKVPDSTVCVLWETDAPKKIERRALFKKLSALSEAHAYPFPELSGVALQTWTSDRIRERGGRTEAAAVRVLCERVGSDLWHMDNEIRKLVAYAGDGTIDAGMVEDLVRASFEGEIFALVDAVSKKQTKRAMELLERERAAGANDFYLMTMLARQVRLLLAARDLLDRDARAGKDALADELGVHPFVASKALSQARAFSMEDLVATHDLLFRYDRDMKSGGIEAGLAVDLVALDLAQ